MRYAAPDRTPGGSIQREQKLWTHEDALDRCLNAVVEAPSGAAIPVNAISVSMSTCVVGRRYARRAERERIARHTALVARTARRPAHEDLAAAWQILGHSSVGAR